MTVEQIPPRTKKTRGLARATIELRETILDIMAEIDGPATVRSVYYLCETRGAVPKNKTGERKVQRQVLAMRREGLIDYHRIADNIRRRIKLTSYDNLIDALECSAAFYRQSVWRDQAIYLEVWTEKDAMVGVLNPVTEKYDVPLMVARGYSSESFAWSSAEQMADAWRAGKVPVILYIGDHDPSGVHMADNLQEKLHGFLAPEFGATPLIFKRLAVNIDQIDHMGLPTRPTKRNDPRLRYFEEKFGRGAPSCEIDAVHPDTLRDILTDAIEEYIPADLLSKVEVEEREAKSSLLEIVESWSAP